MLHGLHVAKSKKIVLPVRPNGRAIGMQTGDSASLMQENCNEVNACGWTPSIMPRGLRTFGRMWRRLTRCEAACDDLHEKPIVASLQIGCILAADVCEPEEDVLSVIDCLNDPGPPAGLPVLPQCHSA